MSTILVADDSPVDRRLAGGILESNTQWLVQYAEDGQQALEVLEWQPIDAVVTDLQMPNLNGLELVEEVRRRWPLVPVVLMTAHGSEEIAVAALASGAASYVPKSQLARDLLETVENVLAMARADRRSERLLECLEQTESRFELENDPALIPPLVDYLQDHVSRIRLCDETGRIRVGVALEEALYNAMYRGNLELSSEAFQDASADLVQGKSKDLIEKRRGEEPYADRRVHVTTRISPTEAVFVVSDDGPGFAPGDVPDPTDPASLEKQRGRGLVLMRSFMDEVSYNDQGNEVTLVKKRDALD